MTNLEPSESNIRRVRTKKGRRKKRKDSFLSRHLSDLLILAGFILGLISLMVAFWFLFVAEKSLIGTPERIAENTRNYSLLIVGSTLFLVTLILGGRALRTNINQQEKWWNGNCPRCEQNALRRMQRKPIDRLIGKIGIPVRRYICKACHWVGLRIDQSRI